MMVLDKIVIVAPLPPKYLYQGFSNYARGDYFKLYDDFFNLRTLPDFLDIAHGFKSLY